MIPAFDGEGRLPPGRYRATPDEVVARYVAHDSVAASTSRVSVWNDLTALVDLVRRRRVRVPAVWVGGTFVTSKVEPSDIDATVLFDASRITNPQTYADVLKIVENAQDVGLKVDGFVIPWVPAGAEHEIPNEYLFRRGKWDDWWQRSVPKDERDVPRRHHAMPVCGYLEVIFDGFK